MESKHGRDLDELVAAGLGGLSEVSEEFDSARWKIRLFDAWSAVIEVAQRRDEAAEWFGAWVPTLFAGQKLGMTAWRLVTTLRDAGLDVDQAIDGFDWATLRDEFEEVRQTFPDAGHVLFGASVLDAFVDDILSSEDTREQANIMVGGVQQMIDDVVSRLIEVWMNPDSMAHAADARVSLEQVERVLQAILDRMIEAASGR